jgi:hypothetical protein
MDGGRAGWLAGWLVGWLAGWLAGWMDGWMDNANFSNYNTFIYSQACLKGYLYIANHCL